MSADIEGKVVVLTGGAQGIGRGVAERLGAAGARLAILDVKTHEAEEVAEGIRSNGGDAQFRCTDIGDRDQTRDAIDWAADHYGRIDGLVNIAAFIPHLSTELGPKRFYSKLAELDLDLWDQEVRVSLTGAMLVSKYTIPHMVAAGGGSIVHFSSMAGLRAMSQGNTGYGVVKAGVIALSRAIASQYGKDRIRSNTIAPGATQSRPRPPEFVERILQDMMLPDLATLDDVASIVRYLVSDESRWITAHVMRTDGGMAERLPYYGAPSVVTEDDK